MRSACVAVLGTVLLGNGPARSQPLVTQGHCVPGCRPGYVCALDGHCVNVDTNDPRGNSTEGLAERQQSASRGQEARHLLRIRLELDYQVVSVGDSLQTNVYGLSVGLRKQLLEFMGVAVQVGGSFGSMHYGHPDNSTLPSDGNVFEAYVELLPYFGPFGRFYAAPALLTGYRGYSVSRLAVPDEIVELKPRWLHEVGGRLGLLLLEQERLDLSLQATSWPEKQAPYRFMGAIAIEFF
jgi:hypothetical protein